MLSIDHFNMRAPVFAPHPHAGFSAVTYLFEDGEGAFVNRDSLGHQLEAQPGAVIWTVAGSGVLHDEFPRTRGKLSHGLQIFVNLPAAEKMQPPRVLFADAPDVPVFEAPGVRARVIAGAVGDVRGAIEPPGGVTFLDVTLDPDAAFEQASLEGQSVVAYVIKGSTDLDGRTLGALEAASLSADGDAVRLRPGAKGVQLVLIAGRPLHEPVVSYGPFIMNTEEQIAAAIARYRAGAMGQLAPVNHA